MKHSERLAALGLELPPVPAPVAAYIPAVRTGSIVLTSGQLPMRAGELAAKGKVPAQVDPDTARDCARLCCLNAIAAAADAAGGIDRIARIVRAVAYVASDPAFTAQPAIANGASELLLAVFGEEAGRHARSAVGVASLPLDAPVEIELVVEVAD